MNSNRPRFRTAILLVCLAVSGVLLRATTVLDFIPLSIDGKPVPLSTYRGKVLLIVNVASNSIFTPQYAGLETLYQKYKDQGLVILAFPSNDFGKEEPGNDAAIKQLAEGKYKITFPLFAKVPLEGEHVAPLFQFLTDKQANPATGGPIHWNFTKFLVDRDGKPVQRFDPDITPDSPELAVAIEKALKGDIEKHDNEKHGSERARAGCLPPYCDILKNPNGHVAI
ncbi:MAG TPA: glutathione peroxidase [Bryobacteraceae bacterium]|nr:glutathione peroxidase [Bryobacteraceae bacterium]